MMASDKRTPTTERMPDMPNHSKHYARDARGVTSTYALSRHESVNGVIRDVIATNGRCTIVVFDTETTGIDDEAKCIQVTLGAIVLDGFDDYCKLASTGGYVRTNLVAKTSDYHMDPERHIDDGASAVTGVGDDDVKGLPTFARYRDEIQSVIDSADVLAGHNVGFDIKRLMFEGIEFTDDVMVLDTMFDYADCCKWRWGERSPLKSLTAAARSFGYAFDAHDSSNDVDATIVVMSNLLAIGEMTARNASMVVAEHEGHSQRVLRLLKNIHKKKIA